MNLPERFDLTCINEKGEKERIVMIHCAIMGSIERFSAVLIEHLAGNFPLWLAPEQVRIVPVTDAHNEYATEVYSLLKEAKLRVVLDDASESMGKKIRAAKTEKLPYFIVIGDQEVSDRTVTLEKRDGTKEVLDLMNLTTKLTAEVHQRGL